MRQPDSHDQPGAAGPDSTPGATVAVDLALAAEPAAVAVSAAPAPGMSRFGFGDDHQALDGWLVVSRNRSRHTWRSYQREAQRFRLFLQLLHTGNPARAEATLLRDATEADVLAYEAALSGRPRPDGTPAPRLHLEAPEPPLDEAGQRRRGRAPGAAFSRHLKRSSVDLALSILRAMYAFWREPDPRTGLPYVLVNPVRRVRAVTSGPRSRAARSIEQDGMRAMLEWLDARLGALTGADSDAAVAARLERLRWMFFLLFGLWGRREEICRLRMGDFYPTAQGWFVDLQRKGHKVQSLAVSQFVLQAMARYRQHLGLVAAPKQGDPQPAIGRLRVSAEADATITPQVLYQEIRWLATQTADALVAGEALLGLAADAEQRERLAEQLRLLSPHWFRHTGPTLAINGGGMTLLEASNFLGHASVQITAAMYHHADSEHQRSAIDALGQALKGPKT